MIDPSIQLTEVIEVDSNGELIDIYLMYPDEINQAIDEGRNIIMHGWSKPIFKPKWDFDKKDWVEDLSPEEVAEKESEIEEQKQELSEENMSALAILELAVEIENIKEGMK